MASLAGGASLEITGSGLGNATAVNFGSFKHDPQRYGQPDRRRGAQSSTYLGDVDVTVVTPGGTSATTPDDQISYVPAATISAVSPATGFISGGELVTIYGTNLDDATAVDFGQTAGTIVDESADTIDVISPAGAVGAAVVTVVAPGGTSATSKQDPFTYVTPPPVVLGVSPAVGPAAGGTMITITGSNLSGATVTIGGETAQIVPGWTRARRLPSPVHRPPAAPPASSAPWT